MSCLILRILATLGANVKQKIVIIGTGLAGYNLSKNIRAINQEVEITLITQGEGHFYSKPMLSTALTQKKSADDLLMFRKEEMAKRFDLNIISSATVKSINPTEQSIEYLLGEQEGKINYTHLVLALGATPNTIDFPKHPDIFQINQWEDYRAFRAKLSGYQHIGIIGSGLVGCEFAHDLAAHTQVSLFSPETCLARWLTPNVSTQVEHALSAIGVNLYTQTPETQVSTDPLTIHSEKTVQVDAIIAAIGLKPNIELAKHSGIETHHGILVNQFCETNVKNVYAIGDCMEHNGQFLCLMH